MKKSNDNWLGSNIYRETLFNNTFVTDYSGVGRLAVYTVEPNITSAIFGDFTKWCSNLLMLPLNLQIGELNNELTINNQQTGVQCQILNTTLVFGFNMGEYKYDRSKMFNDFRDFEPYTTIDVWLPFYGMVNINPQLVAFQDITYIQFRLYVDYHTGQALYVIGVNANSVPKNTTYPYSLLGVDDSDTRIIGQYAFQLGVQIPLGQSGMNEILRNVAISGIKLASRAIPSISNAQSKKQITTQNAFGTTTRTEETTRKYTRDNTANVIYTAADALANLQYQPHIDVVNNSQLMQGTARSIHIIFKRGRVVTNDGTTYSNLYGKPLGKVIKLNTLEGYTEVSAVHIDGENFKKATSNEVDEIINLLKSGVILPPKEV